MAIKLNRMTEQEIESIAEAFAECQYEDGEEGLFSLFPDQKAVYTSGHGTGWNQKNRTFAYLYDLMKPMEGESDQITK